MRTFKKQQLSRVIDSIYRASGLDNNEIANIINKYITYNEYDDAIKDLLYEIYLKFNKNTELFDYSLDMIKTISLTNFYSKKQMIDYVQKRV